MLLSLSACKNLFLLTLLLNISNFCRGYTLSDYLSIREKTIENEDASFFGANLKFNEHETIANKCLMSIKQIEMDEGYQNLSRFYPSREFSEVRSDIEKTEIFKILRLMPKGAVLHSHSATTASLEFIYEHLTTMPHLYVCLQNDTVQFQFFQKPNKDCNWQLMKDLYECNPEIIANIKKQLTIRKLSTPGYNADVFFTKFLEMQEAYSGILRYRPAYEKYMYRGLEELYEDNIMYLEIRSFPVRFYELNGKIIDDPVEILTIFKHLTDRFVATHPGFLGVKVIFRTGKDMNCTEFSRQVESFRRVKRVFPNFVIGFDISNYEDRGHPLVYYIDQLLELDNETSFYFHAGETNWFGNFADENLVDAILLNTKRINLGVALMKHPKLLDMIKEKDIAIELNPISKQIMEGVKDLRTHPASLYFSKNLTIVVSNDNPGYWGSSGLSYDFYEAFIGMTSRKADLRSLKQLAINSINYSAMTKDEKEIAFKIWNKSWMKFVKFLAYEYDCDRKN